jgi:hypothetical protein
MSAMKKRAARQLPSAADACAAETAGTVPTAPSAGSRTRTGVHVQNAIHILEPPRELIRLRVLANAGIALVGVRIDPTRRLDRPIEPADADSDVPRWRLLVFAALL